MTKNTQLIKTWYHEMWNRWNKAIIPSIIHEDVTFRGSLGQEHRGHEGLHTYIDFIQAAFPDFHNKIELILTEGDRSFAQLTYSGTHQGELFGITPTHRKIAYAGSAVFTFRNDKIQDVWVLGDIHGLLQQLK